jgi:hypothetical protein
MSKPRTRYCRNGHDKQLHPRADNDCIVCRTDREVRYRREQKVERRRLGLKSLNQIRLPFAPLEALFLGRGMEIAELPESVEMQFYRGRKRGSVTFDFADEFCCLLGTHGAVVYGMGWSCAGCPLFDAKAAVA